MLCRNAAAQTARKRCSSLLRLQSRSFESVSDKLFRDAMNEEEAENCAEAKSRKFLRSSEPVWAGEESIQDTVLRMLEDKYKPLRTSENRLEAERKQLAKVPRPTVRPPSAQDQEGANGVLIRRTGNNPWDLFYSANPKKEARVYRSKKSIDVSPIGSEMKQQLSKIGMSPHQLPRDDPKAMGKIRESLRSSAKQTRIKSAVDRSLRYPDQKIANVQTERREDEDEDEGKDKEGKPLVGVVSAAKGMAGIAEMKIEEAIRKGTFKQNSLRGKPIPYDSNEGNAHLQREEFILNRMVQRQNAAPPFVEMNMDMKKEERALRQSIQAAWICRAILNLETDAAYSSMEPVVVHWIENDASPSDIPEFTFEAHSDGQKALIAWARDFRDGKWVYEQRNYHEAAVQQLNQTIRRYNHIAPYFARRLLYTKQSFVQDVLDRAFPLLIEAASARLRGLQQAKRKTSPSPNSLPSSKKGWFRRWFRDS
ncbi:hypothetical protein MPSI1_002645 [Malassezia psittaci]|uniref:DnaJ homologue subfamily C member 28 conserved domain-containing protein n=1 Tax=Malassezia psittaci TaxID=1821823 RepID=A0AAF0JEW0_9BASI|nr:hypothetical protein MPSI1_002645 [Malassezia psittaci]